MRRWGLGVLLCGATVIGAACASSGPAAQGPALMALHQSYSGVWEIDEDVSDALDGTRMGNTARTGGVGPDGPGGRPRTVPGGASDGARAPIGAPGRGRLEPEAMRTTLDLAAIRPPRLPVRLDDTHFAITYVETWELPVSGESVMQQIDGQEVEARLRWDGDIPEVERQVKLGGKVIDRFEIITTGRLRVVRRIDMGLGAQRDRRSFRMVFGMAER